MAGNPSDCRLGVIAFPVANRDFMDSDLRGNLELKEAKVASVGADMIA
jgi:hypothetical protein